jgi:hypothetical protein
MPNKKKRKSKNSKNKQRKCSFGKEHFTVLGSNSNGFGALNVQDGMRPVSSFRASGGSRPFLEMPFGPPQRWLMKGPEAPASSAPPLSAFGRRRRKMSRHRFGFGNSLEDKYVNPSGYLSTWYGQPRIVPPSWNYNLMQGNNIFRQGINNPRLDQVIL